MLSTQQIQDIANELAELLKNPFVTNEKKVSELLLKIQNKTDYEKVMTQFGALRRHNTKFMNLTEWLESELTEVVFEEINQRLIL